MIKRYISKLMAYRRLLLPVLVLGSAIIVGVLFVITKPAARKQKSMPMASVVETLTASSGLQRVTIQAMGTVVPVEEITLQPEVSGLIVWKHRNLVPGGIVRKGEILLRVDVRNYEVALRQQQAVLEKAEVEYHLELSRSEVALEEWQMVNPDRPTDPRVHALVLRKPQLRAATAAVRAASNLFAKAVLDVERTSIAAPFNAVVVDEFVDRGQLVTQQTRLAQLAGMDAFRVKVSLPVRDFQWIKLPDIDGKHGAAATILYDIGSEEPLRFTGKVTRMLSSVENAAKMGRLLVRVEDPLMLKNVGIDAKGSRLLLGAYVKVLIDGLPIDNVVEVPDSVIHEGGKLWVMNPKGKLECREVEVLRRQGGKALIKGAVSDGDRIVRSHIASPIPGMTLRTKGQGATKSGPGAKNSGSGRKMR